MNFNMSKGIALFIVSLFFSMQLVCMTEKKTYPPEITDLFLTNTSLDLSQPVHPGAPIQVVCLWKNGNPPVQARLLYRHGNYIEGITPLEGQIRYTFAGVSCQDAGLIHCQAPGASHNKTVRLLVRCLPELLSGLPKSVQMPVGGSTDIVIHIQSHTELTGHNLCRVGKAASLCERFNVTLAGIPPDLTLTVRLDNVRKDEDGQWRLQLENDVGFRKLLFTLEVVRLNVTLHEREVKAWLGHSMDILVVAWSHTREFKGCELTRTGSSVTGAVMRNCSVICVTGTPPDVTLTVRLDNVRKEDGGQWRLELTNNADKGHVHFVLQVNEYGGNATFWRVEVIVAVVIAAVAGVAFGICVTCAVCILKRRGRRRAKSTYNIELRRVSDLGEPDDVHASTLSKRSNARSLVSEHIYDEADAMMVDMKTAAPPFPRPNPKPRKKVAVVIPVSGNPEEDSNI